MGIPYYILPVLVYRQELLDYLDGKSQRGKKLLLHTNAYPVVLI